MAHHFTDQQVFAFKHSLSLNSPQVFRLAQSGFCRFKNTCTYTYTYSDTHQINTCITQETAFI